MNSGEESEEEKSSNNRDILSWMIAKGFFRDRSGKAEKTYCGIFSPDNEKFVI